jgi:hypothetical protein
MIKKAMLFALTGIILLITTNIRISASDNNCGFSYFKPRHITHFAERSAIARVKPQYPLAAEAKGISGKVWIEVLINKSGFVEMTCPLYFSDAHKPDRRLVTAAEAAALQWTFQPNFGFKTVGEIRFDYVEDVLIFEFIPKKPDGGGSR